MTRARLAIHLPPEIRKRLGLKNTIQEILGTVSLRLEATVKPEASVLESISPCSPARNDDPREVTELKAILADTYTPHHLRTAEARCDGHYIASSKLSYITRNNTVGGDTVDRLT